MIETRPSAFSKRLLIAVLFAISIGWAGAGTAAAEPGIGDVVPPQVDAAASPGGLAPVGFLDPPTNMTYHGGSVMHSNTTYAIYWVPAGSAVSANYTSLISGFLQNVATGSGAATNVYSTTAQYTDATGSAAYSSTFGGAVVDTTPFPSGCSNYIYPVSGGPPTYATTSHCVRDDQIQSEINSVITAQGWPRGTGNVYVLLTPQNVGTCYGSSCSYTDFCAYHGNFGSGANTVLYATIPYASSSPVNCGTGQSPNGDDADSTINLVSHEHAEVITDPLLDAWYYQDIGGENGDLCSWSFGPSLGSTAFGQYNQAIGTGKYYVQQEWSNADSACVLNMMPPANTAAPVISGTARTGLTLTASSGAWTTSSTPTYSYKWRRCDAGGINCADIGSATSSTYVPVAADVGGTLRVGVSATTGGGTTGPVASAQTAIVTTAAPSNTVPPSISGTAQVGQTLTASPGTWTSAVTPTYAFQWRQCNAAGSSCADIAGATASTYIPAAGDTGSTIRLNVSASNAGGTTGPIASAQTAVVAQMTAPSNTAPPSISGTAQIGGTLTVSEGTWTGAGSITYAYQWRRCDASGGSCAVIAGETGTSYTVASGDVGSTIGAAVTATSSGGSTSAAAAVTSVVAAPPPATSGGGGGGGGGGGSGGASTPTSPAPVVATPVTAPTITTTQAPFTPMRTLTTHEVVVPKAVVLAAALTHGKTGKLRVKLTTGSGKTLVTATIKRKASLIAKLRSRFSDMKTGKTYTLPWKPPATLRGAITVCMVATNSAGKSGKAACAAATVL